MATKEENKEHKQAIDKIVELESKLEAATTPKQETALEIRLEAALVRLERLEVKSKPKVEKVEEEEEGEEEEETQCPLCGCELNYIGAQQWVCSGCDEVFQE